MDQEIQAFHSLLNNEDTPFHVLAERMKALEMTFTNIYRQLSPYEKQRYRMAMQGLEATLTSKAKAATASSSVAWRSSRLQDVSLRETKATIVTSSAATLPLLEQASSKTIKDKDNEWIVMEVSDCTFVQMEHLTDCIIILTNAILSQVRLQHLERCCVIIVKDLNDAPHSNASLGISLKGCVVNGPIWINDVKHCQFYLSCHQSRIHNSSHSCFYLNTTSHPIIELSNDLTFRRLAPSSPNFQVFDFTDPSGQQQNYTLDVECAAKTIPM